jgi:hypothetical protein
VDGIVLIENQSDIRKMINTSKIFKTLVLYVDHNEFLKGLRPDVILTSPPPCHAPTAAILTHADSSSSSIIKNGEGSSIIRKREEIEEEEQKDRAISSS